MGSEAPITIIDRQGVARTTMNRWSATVDQALGAHLATAARAKRSPQHALGSLLRAVSAHPAIATLALGDDGYAAFAPLNAPRLSHEEGIRALAPGGVAVVYDLRTPDHISFHWLEGNRVRSRRNSLRALASFYFHANRQRSRLKAFGNLRA